MEGYVRGKVLGKGSFGKASVVECKADGTQYVMKEIDISKMPKQEKDAALQEAQLLKSLKHPNIVSCKETFIEKGTLCIIMDYCDSGDLYQALQRRKGVLLPEEQILDWTVQMCLGLKHVHDRKILHRDLKSQNVFMSKGGILKLGDFGVSKILNSTHHLASTAVGTPYYLSPEICQNKKYNQKSDIWSLGCLLYEMTSLKHAFEAGSLKLLIHKIIRGQYPPLSSRYSQELRNLIDKMITKDPEKRPSINQILAEPIIKNRIQDFLSETLHKDEFSHTIIHGRRKPGELVPGAAAVNPSPLSRLGNPPRPGLPSQAPTGRGGAVIVGSGPDRHSAAVSRQPRVAVAAMPPSAAPSDARRIQEAKALQEKRMQEGKEKEEAAKRAREERQQLQRQQREAENRRLEAERSRLEEDRKRMEVERKAAYERRRAADEAERMKRAADAEARRVAEAERLKARAEEMRQRQEEERCRKLAEQKAERDRKEAERLREKERNEAARREFIARQREAMKNREQVEGEVEIRMSPGPSNRPGWQDVTVPDLEEKMRMARIDNSPSRQARASPCSTDLSDAERRRVWEENQAAARRNRAQLEGNQHINVPAGYGQPAAHRQWMGEEEPPRRRERPARSRWGEDRPELANLPLAQRRQIRLEEEAKAREAELQEFQRRNWAEMRAAAERNKRQLAGAGAPGHGAGKQDDVDDSDVKEHAAMVQEMAHVFNQSQEYEDGEAPDPYDDDYEEDEENTEEEKEALRQSLSRFMLNGEEIDLGVDAGATLPARVEALRVYLEKHVGFDAFVKVYQLMEDVSQEDDENEIMEAIFQTLGVEKMPYLQLIHQLIICEESMHTGKV